MLTIEDEMMKADVDNWMDVALDSYICSRSKWDYIKAIKDSPFYLDSPDPISERTMLLLWEAFEFSSDISKKKKDS